MINWGHTGSRHMQAQHCWNTQSRAQTIPKENAKHPKPHSRSHTLLSEHKMHFNPTLTHYSCNVKVDFSSLMKGEDRWREKCDYPCVLFFFTRSQLRLFYGCRNITEANLNATHTKHCCDGLRVLTRYPWHEITVRMWEIITTCMMCQNKLRDLCYII